MSTTKKVIKNFASLTLAEIVTRLCAMLLFIYIARVLGVTSFGELAFATSIIGFFNFFADFGLTTLGIREIARHKEKTNAYAVNILIFQVLLTMVLIGIAGIMILLIPVSNFLKLVTFLYALGLLPLALDMSYVFQAHERMEFVLVGKIVNQLSYLVLGFVLITLFKNVIYIPLAAVISGIVGAIVTYVMLKKVLSLKLLRPDMSIIRMFVLAAIPFVTSGVLSTVYHNLDSVMLQFMRGTNEVGFYSSGYKIVNILIMIISFVSSSFFPLISYSFKHDKKQLQKYILLFSQTIGLLAVPLAVGGIIYAHQVLVLFYGNKFITGADAFKILLLLVVVIPFNILISTIVIAADRQNVYMIAGALGAGIDILFNIILIPRYGMIGAGIATVITEVGVGIYLVSQSFGIFAYTRTIIHQYFTKPLLASIPMGLFAFFLPNILIGIPVATIVYFGVLYAFKGIPDNLTAILLRKLPLKSIPRLF